MDLRKLINLQEINEKHIPAVQKYASDPKIGATSNVPSPYPENGANLWFSHIKKNNATSNVFAIMLKNEFAGIISLNGINLTDSSANIDYWVRSDLHSKGIATKAVSSVIAQAAKKGITTFISGCLLENTASKKVLQKNNFKLISTNKITKGKFTGKEFITLSRSNT